MPRRITYRDAIREALDEEIARDPMVVVMGGEVAQYNGAYKVTQGLWDKWGDKRLVDTPISQAGFIGMGIGASMLGVRPVMALMLWSFYTVAWDQIVNNGAMVRYMSGGKINVPIVDDPFVRACTVRIVCDAAAVNPWVAGSIAIVAEKEAYTEVRKQMASSARRLPPELAIPIIRALLRFDEDAADIHQPFLIWWALEAQMGRTGVEQITSQLLSDPGIWQRPLMKQTMIERLMKRMLWQELALIFWPPPHSSRPHQIRIPSTGR